MLKACVIGWPVKHSRSPVIHNFWLKKYGIAGSYEAIAVTHDDLKKFLRGLGANGFAGCNITLPHKEDALHLMDEVEPLAHKAGAVNSVVVRENGALYGFNTDVHGFTKNLESAGGAWKKKQPALVVGAGGAARAAAVALVEAGCEKIYITNRTPDRLRRFADELSAALNFPLHMVGWPDREDALPGVSLVVNATSQGMEGQAPLELDLRKLKNDALVTDLVYTPLETPLLLEARRRNHPVVDGLGMLLHQAAPGFKAWFGRMPEVDAELRKAVVADLARERA
ncbi:MAG TPA: shikimate dehydrogenase [Alphaproteobacteria bacterium]|nr:shikimate dehydrogenase [Alphaproteobacteria bacterium]